MPHYNFVEIGTSNFDTLIEKASNDTVGISVEPISQYLDELPNKNNVKKINCAISADDTASTALVYYIPKSVIKEHNLSKWLVGCNSINSYHPNHLDKKELVSTKEINQIPIGQLFVDHDIRSLDLLKIDTEGFDTFILKNLFKFLKENTEYAWPEKIIFESNKLTSKHNIDSIISMYTAQGYKINKRGRKNTSMSLKHD